MLDRPCRILGGNGVFIYLIIHWWYLFIYLNEIVFYVSKAPEKKQNAVIYIDDTFMFNVSMELEPIYLVFSMLWSM